MSVAEERKKGALSWGKCVNSDFWRRLGAETGQYGCNIPTKDGILVLWLGSWLRLLGADMSVNPCRSLAVPTQYLDLLLLWSLHISDPQAAPLILHSSEDMHNNGKFRPQDEWKLLPSE
jgi:hypothetical protein